VRFGDENPSASARDEMPNTARNIITDDEEEPSYNQSMDKRPRRQSRKKSFKDVDEDAVNLSNNVNKLMR
jgi:hypothetical protein